MAQLPQTIPNVYTTATGQRKEVPLRDFLNARIAPFLREAMTESLQAEAKYPLAWLGEHLIQQSILYEGNPDETKICERFIYNHDVKSPVPPPLYQQPQQQQTSTPQQTSQPQQQGQSSYSLPSPSQTQHPLKQVSPYPRSGLSVDSSGTATFIPQPRQSATPQPAASQSSAHQSTPAQSLPTPQLGEGHIPPPPTPAAGPASVNVPTTNGTSVPPQQIPQPEMAQDIEMSNTG